MTMAILVSDSKRYAAAQRGQVPQQGKYSGGMRALGMRSRIRQRAHECPARAQEEAARRP